VEREAFKRHVAEAQAQLDAERKARQAETATKAAEIWNAAAPAPSDHPYFVRKSIQAHGTRLYHDALLIPMREGGELHSLQFIGPDGDKRFLSGGRVAGCYFSIGGTQGAMALCIAEGFATGSTIHQATGHPVAVAFNAGNLKAVAQGMRARFPTLPLIVCADDDAATFGNPGLTKANEAARAVGGLLATPDFGPERPPGATDFNDMAAARGMDVVRDAIKSAVAPDDGGGTGSSPAGEPWPEPQTLAAKVDPEPYPLDAMPDTIRAAVEEVQGFTKAPVPLVASSALAALSLTIQAHADAKRAEKLTGPVSLFLLTIADSGERKSTCDGFFTKAIRDYERHKRSWQSPRSRITRRPSRHGKRSAAALRKKSASLPRRTSRRRTWKRPCATWNTTNRSRRACRACSMRTRRRKHWPTGWRRTGRRAAWFPQKPGSCSVRMAWARIQSCATWRCSMCCGTAAISPSTGARRNPSPCAARG
jgi:putative DNA primase/helicase